MAKAADVYFAVDPWKIVEEGYDPSYSRVSESVFSLANESMGVRGFFDEGGGDSLRGLYVNGVYEMADIPRSYRGIIDQTHFMIPAADWLMTRITLDGEKLDLSVSRFSSFRREMDMRSGVLTRSFIWHAASGKDLRLRFERFLDMTRRERAYQRVTMEPLNFASGEAEIVCGITFDVKHEGYGKCFWRDGRAQAEEGRLAAAARAALSGKEVFAGALIGLPPGAEARSEGGTALLRAVLPLEMGRETAFDRRAVILFDGSGGDALWRKGMKALEETEKVSLDSARAEQKKTWDAWWRVSDIAIAPAGKEHADVAAMEQQGIRFCIFQLAQTYSGGSMRHNIGAKGLTGEAYNGHAFWDTESCCLPFYLFTNPAAARDLLLFRYNTLPQAMERAKELDCAGACYPIATLNGREACSLWQHASLQLQPSTAVAYGIWHYWRVTGDEDFLFARGAEMLLQISRFLVSRAAVGSETGKYGFFGVMGPDEFHMMVNNNAYTNYMGLRTMAFAAETLCRMRETRGEEYAALKAKTGLEEREIDAWRDVAGNMLIPRRADGLIEQHDGFFNLPHTDVNAIPVTDFPLYEHWSYDRIYRTDMIKQPDVLMMLYLYNSSFSEAVKRINYDYYEPRTIHESSLSPAIHSILAAELGNMEDAVRFFGYATRLDLDNYNRNTREGLHITSIAMAWANIVYGFAGLRSDGDTLRFAPRLPDRWREVRFAVAYRGRVIRVAMDREKTLFTLESGEKMTLRVYGRDHVLDGGGLEVPGEIR